MVFFAFRTATILIFRFARSDMEKSIELRTRLYLLRCCSLSLMNSLCFISIRSPSLNQPISGKFQRRIERTTGKIRIVCYYYPFLDDSHHPKRVTQLNNLWWWINYFFALSIAVSSSCLCFIHPATEKCEFGMLLLNEKPSTQLRLKVPEAFLLSFSMDGVGWGKHKTMNKWESFTDLTSLQNRLRRAS